MTHIRIVVKGGRAHAHTKNKKNKKKTKKQKNKKTKKKKPEKKRKKNNKKIFKNASACLVISFVMQNACFLCIKKCECSYKIFLFPKIYTRKAVSDWFTELRGKAKEYRMPVLISTVASIASFQYGVDIGEQSTFLIILRAI